MSNTNEHTNSTMQNQSSENQNGEKKTPFWKRVNDSMNDINSAVGTLSSIHEKIGSPLSSIKKFFSNTPTESKTEKSGNDNENRDVCIIHENVKKTDESSAIVNSTHIEKNSLNKSFSKDTVKEKNNESALEQFENQLQVLSENPEYSFAIKKYDSS